MYSPKPIPDTPTHCRKCRDVLEPLRRWGGLCKRCVTSAKPGRLHDPQALKWTVVKEFKRKRRGVVERCVRVRCTCGRERTMSRADWNSRRSTCCKRCSLAHFSVSELGRTYA
jgi:hypothetical protein